MKIYTIVGGVNGAGKSSLSGVLSAQRTDLGIIIDVDQLVAAHGGDKLAGGREAIAKINSCLERGLSFTQETTLAGRRTLQTIRRARDLGYTVRLYYVGLDTAEESIRRIANRVSKGGHDIPPEDVRRRFAGRFEAVAAVLPYCDEATFFDNDNGFVEVAQYRNGQLLPLGPRRPQWLAQLQETLAQG